MVITSIVPSFLILYISSQLFSSSISIALCFPFICFKVFCKGWWRELIVVVFDIDRERGLFYNTPLYNSEYHHVLRL